MTFTAAEILTDVSVILHDEDHVRWPLSELAKWLNDGLRATVLAKPSAKSQSVVLSLAEGTHQKLADTHLSLLRITRNIKSEGPPRVGGRAVRVTSRDMLDAGSPGWHDRDVFPYKVEARQFVYDEENPREYYVFPGNTGAGKVEAVVAVLPTLVTASGNAELIASYSATVDLPEPYGPVLKDYVLYRAYAKDEMGGDSGRSQVHYRAWADAVGLKVNVEKATSPNARKQIEK